MTVFSISLVAQGSNDYRQKFNNVEYLEFGNPFDGITINLVIPEVNNHKADLNDDSNLLELMGAALAAEKNKSLYVIFNMDESESVELLFSGLPIELCEQKNYDLLEVSMAFDKNRLVHDGTTPYPIDEIDESDDKQFRFRIDDPISLFKTHSVAFLKVTNTVTKESEIYEFNLSGFTAAMNHHKSRF